MQRPGFDAWIHEIIFIIFVDNNSVDTIQTEYQYDLLRKPQNVCEFQYRTHKCAYICKVQYVESRNL
jgi:hypothetical protein